MAVDDVELPAAQGFLDEMPARQPLQRKSARRDIKFQPLDFIVERFMQPMADDRDGITGVERDSDVLHGYATDRAVRSDSFENVAEFFHSRVAASLGTDW